MDQIMELFTKANIISGLEDDDKKELLKKAQKKLYSKGDYICYQDELWENMAFVYSGEVKWTICSPDGKRQVVFGLQEGCVVIGHSFFDGKGMPASLFVNSDSEVYLWPKEVVIPILSRNQAVLWEIMKILVTNMRKVRDVVYGFSFQPVSKRLANLLLSHYDIDNGEAAPRDLTLDEIAAEVGTTRELISRILHEFAKDGTINITRKSIIFNNKDKLEEIAEKKIIFGTNKELH